MKSTEKIRNFFNMINNLKAFTVANYKLNLGRLSLHEKYRTSKFPILHKKYRSHFEILALILEAVKGNNASPSSIMKHTSTNHKQLKKYLGSLTETGFIETNIEEGRVSYRASEKGLAFLRQYYILLGMLLGTPMRNNQLTLFVK